MWLYEYGKTKSIRCLCNLFQLIAVHWSSRLLYAMWKQQNISQHGILKINSKYVKMKCCIVPKILNDKSRNWSFWERGSNKTAFRRLLLWFRSYSFITRVMCTIWSFRIINGNNRAGNRNGRLGVHFLDPENTTKNVDKHNWETRSKAELLSILKHRYKQ